MGLGNVKEIGAVLGLAFVTAAGPTDAGDRWGYHHRGHDRDHHRHHGHHGHYVSPFVAGAVAGALIRDAVGLPAYPYRYYPAPIPVYRPPVCRDVPVERRWVCDGDGYQCWTEAIYGYRCR